VYVIRSEQDKEPEPEGVSEVAGPGQSEEVAPDGMWFNLLP
jgi:cytoskeleton-associated protein 5